MRRVVQRSGKIFNRVEEVVTLAKELHESIKMPINSLNNMDGVEVAIQFWVSSVKVLGHKTKRML